MAFRWTKIVDDNGSISQFIDPESQDLSFALEISEWNNNQLLGMVLNFTKLVNQNNSYNTVIDTLSLHHNHTYFARLWCFNDAGLNSSIWSSGILVDLTPPEISLAFVRDVAGGDKSKDSQFSPNSDVLAVFFGGFTDCESYPCDSG